ncbi:DUF2778 domain-containing protein [Phyllobacterium zundukense]|uniref:Tlde1 domain-containing protein n=1 Tax=Phyllobacterium zundukense TaxID=1867719 RepID=A0A2N9VSK6_9HYPH|nr:DUF2778 domain-containing protein [Phyllobacterium zundukense]ATU92890.1 hypothetical protein BLM14_15610 [Phyllobacterium zundukense]PIO42474.1 hypothetical protein B5P45_26065 [Phyllobacterium zundukense]
MAFGVKTVRGVRPSGLNGRHPGRRLLSATLLAGLGVITSLGALATVAVMHGAFMPHGADRGGIQGLAQRPFAASSLALVAPYEAAPRNPKYPRVPDLTHTPWQAITMEEGAVIGPTGEISVITPPRPRIAAIKAQAPLAAEAFGARASGIDLLADEDFGARATGLDTMQVASIQTYSIIDATLPVTAPPAEGPSVAALQDAPPPADYASQGPFSLVLAEADPSQDVEGLTAVPLPGMRPDRPAETSKGGLKVLAYAPQDNDIRDVAPTYEPPAPRLAARGRTAIYSIEAKTVYMPNGEKLEAHSGLGPMLDNPRYVHKKMRGATPPHTYKLTMREKLFHGVEAIRLNPVEPGKIFGRDGLLAHTYMLGPRGDSNGCVSIKDYRRFLAAFKRGEITQLVVVARMPSSSLFASR